MSERLPKEVRKSIKEQFKEELMLLKSFDVAMWRSGYPKAEKRFLRKLYELYDAAYEQGHATGVLMGVEIDKMLNKKND